MGRILLHAGMGKAGSTSIQSWLEQNAQRLRTEAEAIVLTGRVGESGKVRLPVWRSGRINSSIIWRHYSEHPEKRSRLEDTLFAELDRQARAHGTTIISGEAFQRPFWQQDKRFVGRLDDLAADHDVEVAYYVRPQHTALEAAWRQWGFRTARPAVFLEGRCKRLDHFRTLSFMRDYAPRVRFVIRPFRRDLLQDGSVAEDFAQTFFGMSGGGVTDVWANRGLPLEVANALRDAPDGLLWASMHDNMRLDRVKEFVAELDLATSDEARMSRLVLQQTCHERFEPQNRRLIAALGWGTDSWVPPVEEDIGEVSFGRLDELWRSRANQAELMLLHHALARLVECEKRLAKRGR